MIEYKDIIGKRVLIVIMQGNERSECTLIPGMASIDEPKFMFQVKPDHNVCDTWDKDSFVGIGLESFENDIVVALDAEHSLRKEFDCTHMIVIDKRKRTTI